jgi:hypothetical protein
MTAIRALLDNLEDPFNMFPLEAVSRQLSKLIDSAEERRASRSGWWGVSPKYRSVEDEHDLEVVRLLIGSCFVLGQAAITQSVSIATKVRALAGDPTWLPNGKAAIVATQSVINPATAVSEIAVFDAVANYFKHHYEWPSGWSGSASVAQQRTIDIVVKLGLVPGGEDNLHLALQGLGMNAKDMTPLGRAIQGWRERVAEDFRQQLDAHGLG